MSVQNWLNRIWYDRAAPPWWLLPLSLTYGAVAAAQKREWQAVAKLV